MSRELDDERSQKRAAESQGINSNSTSSNPACDQCRSRKIRCDRESPSCSNCQKASLTCDFSNKGKRINHAKQLVEDFSTLSGRLESIDVSIARITRRLEIGEPLSSDTCLQGDTSSTSDDLDRFIRGTYSGGASVEDDDSHFGKRRPIVGVDQNGNQTCYGPTSTISLIQHTRSLIRSVLEADQDNVDNIQANDDERSRISLALASDLSAKAALQLCEDTFPFPDVIQGNTVAGDGKPVRCPPQYLLESCIDFYLEEVNTVLPLFDENRLRSAVKAHYTTGRNITTNAWNLCLNNIVVIAMGLKLKTAALMKVQQREFDEDIFLPFLANSRRAFDVLGSYSEPRLINVQTVISLSQDTINERRLVFWTLYILDKRRSFLAGNGCDIYLFESDMDTLPYNTPELPGQTLIARIHLMSIWEEIWLSLYSSRSLRKSIREREEQIERLGGHLTNWATQYKDLLSNSDRDEIGTATSMGQELRYCFHVGQILIYKCVDQAHHHQQLLNNARAALRIITDVYKTPKSTADVSLLGRLFRSYPVVAFHEVHLNALCNADIESQKDVELLQATVGALQVFKSQLCETVYYNRLSAGMEWCNTAVLIIRKAVLQLQCFTPNLYSISSSPPVSRSESLRPKSITSKRGSICLEHESGTNSSNSHSNRPAKRRPSPPDTKVNSSESNSSGSGITQESCSSDLPMLPTPPPTAMEAFSPLRGFDVTSDSDVFSFNEFIKQPSETPAIPINLQRNMSIDDPRSGMTLAMQAKQKSSSAFGPAGSFFFTPESPDSLPILATNNANRTNPYAHPRNHSLSQIPQGPMTPTRHVPTHRHTISMPQIAAPLVLSPLSSSYSAFHADLLDSSFTNSNYHVDAPAFEPSTWDDYMDFGPLDMLGTMLDET